MSAIERKIAASGPRGGTVAAGRLARSTSAAWGKAIFGKTQKRRLFHAINLGIRGRIAQ